MRESKEKKYKKEREEMLREIMEKIGITENKNKILREELETEEIKEFIREKEGEIKRYYSTSNWKSMYRDGKRELNIIKNIMRENNIEILKIEKKRLDEIDGKYKSYRIYIFEIK